MIYPMDPSILDSSESDTKLTTKVICDVIPIPESEKDQVNLSLRLYLLRSISINLRITSAPLCSFFPASYAKQSEWSWNNQIEAAFPV